MVADAVEVDGCDVAAPNKGVEAGFTLGGAPSGVVDIPPKSGLAGVAVTVEDVLGVAVDVDGNAKSPVDGPDEVVVGVCARSLLPNMLLVPKPDGPAVVAVAPGAVSALELEVPNRAGVVLGSRDGRCRVLPNIFVGAVDWAAFPNGLLLETPLDWPNKEGSR